MTVFLKTEANGSLFKKIQLFLTQCISVCVSHVSVALVRSFIVTSGALFTSPHVLHKHLRMDTMGEMTLGVSVAMHNLIIVTTMLSSQRPRALQLQIAHARLTIIC